MYRDIVWSPGLGWLVIFIVLLQAAWLPVVVRSWTSVRLEYSVAHYTYASRGFDYAAAYSFNDDAMCGQRTYTTHSGKINQLINAITSFEMYETTE